MNVLRVGVAAGGAEELYRKVVLAELSGEGQPQGPGPVVEGKMEAAAAFAPVSPADPRWKKRCLVLVTAVAGGSSGHDDGDDGAAAAAAAAAAMAVDQERQQQGVKVTVEMTSGGDRAAFWKLAGLIPGEVARTNRRWRRKLGQGQQQGQAQAQAQQGAGGDGRA